MESAVLGLQPGAAASEHHAPHHKRATRPSPHSREDRLLFWPWQVGAAPLRAGALATALHSGPMAQLPRMCLTARYGSALQELVRDDNAEQASLLLPLDLAAQGLATWQGGTQVQQAPEALASQGSNGSGGGAAVARSCSCRYKFNRLQPEFGAGGYYECLALALEWDRAAHTFRWPRAVAGPLQRRCSGGPLAGLRPAGSRCPGGCFGRPFRPALKGLVECTLQAAALQLHPSRLLAPLQGVH